jgi:hypothetical protein
MVQSVTNLYQPVSTRINLYHGAITMVQQRGNRGKVGAIGPKSLHRGNKGHSPSAGARKKPPLGR